MRQIGSDKCQVTVVVWTQMIADEPMAPAIRRQRELVLGVVVPLERNAVTQTSIEKGDR